MLNLKMKIMKKIVFVLSFVFAAGIAMSSMANEVIIDNNVKTSIVDSDDKKPCPKDCTAECCTAKDAKSETKSATKAESKCCTKAKSCVKAKDAEKKDTKTTPAKKE